MRVCYNSMDMNERMLCLLSFIRYLTVSIIEPLNKSTKSVWMVVRPESSTVMMQNSRT